MLDASYTYNIQRTATQMRLGLMRLLFQKASQLSNQERSERGIGAIVSHLQMDTRILSQGKDVYIIIENAYVFFTVYGCMYVCVYVYICIYVVLFLFKFSSSQFLFVYI